MLLGPGNLNIRDVLILKIAWVKVTLAVELTANPIVMTVKIRKIILLSGRRRIVSGLM